MKEKIHNALVWFIIEFTQVQSEIFFVQLKIPSNRNPLTQLPSEN